VLTWRGIPQRLICAACLGAVVTVIGYDFHSVTQTEIHGEGGFGVILFDAFFLPLALSGMAFLLGVGAALGGIGRLLSSRCPCGRWLPRLGSPIPWLPHPTSVPGQAIPPPPARATAACCDHRHGRGPTARIRQRETHPFPRQPFSDAVRHTEL
jgi:ABC-type sugar transport system permease subunit